jgi:hypothetical protein
VRPLRGLEQMSLPQTIVSGFMRPA